MIERNSVFDKASVFDKLYFIFIAFLPFVYSKEIVDPVLIPRQIYLTIFVFIVGLIISNNIYRKKVASDFSFLKLFLPIATFSFFLINVLSTFQSTVISETIYIASKLSVEILFYIITTYLIIQKKLGLPSLIVAVVCFCIVSILIASYQIYDHGFSREGFLLNPILITSSFANKNLFASILFLSLPFLINTASTSKRWRTLSLIVLPVLLFLIMIIKTRAVIIALLLFSVIYLLVFFRKNNTTPRFLYKTLGLFTLISGVVFFISQQKTFFSQILNGNTAKTRLELWGNTFRVIKENVMLGVGSGNWKIIAPKFGTDHPNVNAINDGLMNYQRPHNDFLWVFSETGVLGFIAYVLIFAATLFYLWKLLSNAKEQISTKLYLSLFSTIIGYVFIALVDFPLERIEHQVILGLIFSIVTAHYCTTLAFTKTTSSIILKLPIFVMLLLTPVLFSFVVSINRYTGEKHTQKLYKYHSRTNWNQMIKEADKASNYFYSIDPASAPIVWYKGVAQYALGNKSKAQINFESAYSIAPYNVHVINNLASCYVNQNNHNKAEELYLKALSISPTFEEARLNLSAVYYNTKKYEQAFEMIDKCSVLSKDAKYKTFLPVILKAWLGLKLEATKNETVKNNLQKAMINKKQMIKLYFDSKGKRVSFVE